MYFHILILLSSFCFSNWSNPVSAKFSFTLPKTHPPPTAPPTPAKNVSEIDFRGFRVKFQDIRPYQRVILDVPQLRLSFFDNSKFGTYDYGSMIDLKKGYIKAPVHGVYSIHVAIQLQFLSWNETISNKVSVAVCNLHCTSVLSQKVWMYHTTKIEEGEMTLETSSILELMKGQILSVYLFFPDSFRAKINSRSTISAALIKSFD